MVTAGWKPRPSENRTYWVGSSPPSVTRATSRTKMGLLFTTPATTRLTSSEVLRNSPVSSRYCWLPLANSPERVRRFETPNAPKT